MIRNSQGIYRVSQFDAFDWLEHGFGTRHSPSWAEPNRLAMLKQVHSSRVVVVDSATGYIGEGDALISDRPGMLVGVRTADCVPVLLLDARRRAVAVIHAGWRGSADEIAHNAVAAMRAEYGTEPADIHAAIGPCIRECCYEVGPDVAQRFARWIPALAGVESPVGIDLAAVNRMQLENAGVPVGQIYDCCLCTRCLVEDFHSYRRDGARSGRMISAIGIR
jgi:YfiH family protein